MLYSAASDLCWLRQRCCVSCITGVSNRDWLSVGQGLLSLQQVRVEGECFYLFCFLAFIHFALSPLSHSYPLCYLCLSSPFLWETHLPFSRRRHKMTLKGWHVIKFQHNQSDLGLHWLPISIYPFRGFRLKCVKYEVSQVISNWLINNGCLFKFT